MTACFTLRTILNLAYLYLSPDKDADLQRVVQGLSAAGMIPVAGEVLKLLLMICWASAEAAVDCAGLAEGGKVPLMKDRNTWNMSVEQLLHAAAGGGKASEYFKIRYKRMGLSSISDVVFNADTDREKNHQNDTADREQCVADERL